MNEVTVELASGRHNILFSRELRDFLFLLLKRWLREPLLHFLFIGLAVFAVYAYMHRGRGGIESSKQIVLSLDELRQMDTYFFSQWHRQPTPAEFQALVEDKVREEVLYREALAKEFGPQFVVALEKVKPGSWQGPIESAYGWHLVFVDTVIPGRIPVLEEIEPDAKTAWLAEQKATAWQKAYAEMRAKYAVLLPGPAEKETAQAPAPPSKKQVPALSREAPL